MIRRGALRRQEQRIGWLLVTPAVIGLVAFQGYPVVSSLVISFTRWNLITKPRWVGLRNYRDLLTDDPTFLLALKNTALYSVGTVVPCVLLSLLVAVMLNQRIRGRTVYRAVYFIPVVAPAVSAGILWTWIYEPQVGILNYLLGLVGVSGPAWLGDPRFALPAVVVVGIWQGLGYNIVILLAGLQNIPSELLEAAAIDGAGAWSRFRHVTFPMLSPATFFVLVLSIIGAAQVFTTVYVMTGGGPANATLTVVPYLYQTAFQFQDMGTASAMSYILFALLGLLTALNFALQRVWVFYDD